MGFNPFLLTRLLYFAEPYSAFSFAVYPADFIGSFPDFNLFIC